MSTLASIKGEGSFGVEQAFLAVVVLTKLFLVSIALLGMALSSAAEAKGCIKGAIVGGLAGHMAGHGKVGAAAGCVIGHHEANKADAKKSNARAQVPSDKK